MVWPLGVPPTKMKPHAVGRQAGQGVLQDFYMHLHYLDKLFLTQVRELGDPGHRKVGTIDLKQQAGVDYGFVVIFHDFGQRVQVGFV